MDESQSQAWTQQRTEEAEASPRGETADDASGGVGQVGTEEQSSASTCPGKTLMQGSQSNQINSLNPDLALSSHFDQAVFAIDWLECGGVVAWNDEAGRESFWMLSRMQDEAKNNGNKPVPLNLKGRSMLLYPRGMGTGNQSRLEYRIEFAGITVAASSRDKADRKLSNFYYNIPGEVCLLIGADESRKIVFEVVESLGGVVIDEWIKRIDLCVDLPGLDLREELVAVFEQGHFVSTAKRWNAWDGSHGKTGFTVGSRGRVVLNVYDKLLDTLTRHDGVYELAMKERRWGGKLPSVATRVEYQLAGGWLRSFGLKTIDMALRSLPSIVAKVTGRPPHAFFCLTDRDPDSANHHQSRAGVLPTWARIIDTMQHLAGKPGPSLRPLERGTATLKHTWTMLRAYIVSAAAQLGHVIENLDDAKSVLMLLAERNASCDVDLFDRWSAKARKLGTLNEVLRFIPPREEGFV